MPLSFGPFCSRIYTVAPTNETDANGKAISEMTEMGATKLTDRICVDFIRILSDDCA